MSCFFQFDKELNNNFHSITFASPRRLKMVQLTIQVVVL